MNQQTAQAIQTLPENWANVEYLAGSLPADTRLLQSFVLELAKVLFTDEVDGKQVWNLDKPVNGGDLVNCVNYWLEDLGLIPQGNYVPASWEELKRGDRVALFPQYVVTLTGANANFRPARCFQDKDDLRGLEAKWVVEEPHERVIRRVISEDGSTLLLSTHVYRYTSDVVFVRDRGDA